jgi:hypothetical protein
MSNKLFKYRFRRNTANSVTNPCDNNGDLVIPTIIQYKNTQKIQVMFFLKRRL